MTPLRVGICSDYTEEGWPSMDRVATQLLAALAHDRHDIRAEAIRPPFVRRVTRIVSGSGAANIDRGLNRLVDYPRHVAAQARAHDVFHIVDHSYSQLAHQLPPGRVVITCHDLDTFESVLDSSHPRRSAAFRVMTRHILRGFAKAASVACCTAAIKQELVAHRLIAEDRIVVVPNGVGDEFSIEAHAGADEAAERLLGPRRPCDVLHVGSTIPRKRIEVLLRVFHALLRVQPAARLLRVGGPLTPAQERLATALGLRDAMVELPPIDDHVLAAVYRRAYATVLPSQREGFGFPVAESLRCGTPVVATDLPVLREVGGVYASYCASDDEDAWVPAILGSRTGDGELDRRQALDRAAWSGRFTWRRYADQMLSIYEAVAERRPAPAELVHSLT